MLNNCEFIGNLGNDPEIRTASGGSSFTTFSIAVNKQGANREDKPLWVNVTAFGKTGEFVGKYLKKGNMVFVQGALELQEYEGKDGKNHVSVKLLANKVVSLSKKEGSGTSQTTSASTPAATATAAAASPITDEDIPF